MQCPTDFNASYLHSSITDECLATHAKQDYSSWVVAAHFFVAERVIAPQDLDKNVIGTQHTVDTPSLRA